MFLYVIMAIWSGIGLAFNTRLSSMVATAIAPTGAMFTFLALWTGALWGKPMWGTWWVWDARLTSELILLFLYIGFMSLQAAIDDPRRADKAGRVGMPLGAGLGLYLGWGPRGMWIGLIAGLTVAALLLCRRFLHSSRRVPIST